MSKKPHITAAKGALQAFQEQAAAVSREREETAAEIGRLKNEIARLKGLPVSRADFSQLLKKHIAAQAERSIDMLLNNLTHTDTKPSGEIVLHPFNQRSMADLEVKRYQDVPDWLFSPDNTAGISGGLLALAQLKPEPLQSLFCFLFPEIVHDKIMGVIDSEIGEKWGNEEQPSVAQRQETIIDLEAQIADLQAKLKELDDAIAEFKQATGGNPNVADLLSDHQRAILANYGGL